MNDSMADIIVQRDEWMQSAKQLDIEVVSLRTTITALVGALEAALDCLGDAQSTGLDVVDGDAGYQPVINQIKDLFASPAVTKWRTK